MKNNFYCYHKLQKMKISIFIFRATPEVSAIRNFKFEKKFQILINKYYHLEYLR